MLVHTYTLFLTLILLESDETQHCVFCLQPQASFMSLSHLSSVSLRYLDRRVFVMELLRGGVAQADMFAEPGDIIDEINGISLRNSNNGQVWI